MSVWYTATEGMPTASAASTPHQPSTNGDARCTMSASCPRRIVASCTCWPASPAPRGSSATASTAAARARRRTGSGRSDRIAVRPRVVMTAPLKVAHHLQERVRHAVHVRRNDSASSTTFTLQGWGAPIADPVERALIRRGFTESSDVVRRGIPDTSARGIRPSTLRGRWDEGHDGRGRASGQFEEEHHGFRRTCHHHHRSFGDELRRRRRRRRRARRRRPCAT